MNNWSPARIEEFRRSGAGEALALERIEAAALLFLNQRDSVLCCLSAEDGEWSETGGISKKALRRMKVLMQIINDEANGAVDKLQQPALVWGVLDRICETHKYDAIVWDLRPR